jgi:toxin ParE1/3/4
MNWRVEIRPEAERDVAAAAASYNRQREGLGSEFVEEIIQVWDALAENPLLNSKKSPGKNVRWRFPERFPYRVVYEVDEAAGEVVVAAILHAAMDDRHWKQRIENERREDDF